MSNLAQVRPTFQNGYREDEASGVDSEDFIVNSASLGSQSAETIGLRGIERIDLGLWLLGSADTRQEIWERLLRSPLPALQVRDVGVVHIKSITKRCFDVLGASILLVLLFPILLAVAVLIKCDSEGPVLFRHNRVGKDDRRFTLWKFRSMRTDVPKYEVSPKSATDARLTRVGRWIRRMSIDELPQLVNVLKGEMSLVGPRPEMPFIVQRYDSLAWARLKVKPGITGLWQISPARAFPIHENLQYDLHYIRNQNLLLDCAIVARTITAVIHGVGAV